MLELKESDRIAVSTTRHCYLHPDDPDKVVKIIIHPAEQKKRLDPNMKEWKYYERLKKMAIPLNFTTTYHGFVVTNLGRGLVSECIRDFDGKLSVRLEEVVNHKVQYDIDEIERKLYDFTQMLIKHNIQLFDLNRHNLLIQRKSDGSYHPVTIDLKGPYNNYEFIPFSTYIPFLSRQKLTRRGKRLMDIIRVAKEERQAAG